MTSYTEKDAKDWLSEAEEEMRKRIFTYLPDSIQKDRALMKLDEVRFWINETTRLHYVNDALGYEGKYVRPNHRIES